MHLMTKAFRWERNIGRGVGTALALIVCSNLMTPTHLKREKTVYKNTSYESH